MDKINLQSKTLALSGTIESYWFENEQIGLINTLFHRICIPLSQFDSGLDYEEQPIKTDIQFDWYALGLSNPAFLGDIDLSHQIYTDAEASVYIGSAHNWCRVKELRLQYIEDDTYRVVGELLVEFENEGVAENEIFTFTTTATYKNI